MIRTSLMCLLVAALAGAGVAQERPKLGVRVHPSSVLVSDVVEGSVAAAAGLREGDVIVRCGKTDVETIDDLINWLGGIEGAQKTTLDVRRGNDQKTLSVQFREGEARLGIEVTGGLSVLSVTEGSVAGEAGVKAGDVIVGFGGDEIETFESLRNAIGEVEVGEEVSIRVDRGGVESEMWARFAAAAPTAPGQEPRRPRRGPPGMPPGMPPFPGMDALGSLMEVGQMHSDLAEAIESLTKMDDPALAGVIEKLQGVHGRMSKMAEAVQGIKEMADGIMGGMEGLDEAFGGGMPDLSEIQDRLQELMQDGLSLEKIQKIIAEEFPGVMIEMGGDHEHDEHDEHDAPAAPEKDHDKK